ncbi:hypothetical protein [Arcobacter peruensis]|uniref:hypothetical protein n=1 Tax=Arcobacter peruensis TaxID=2320140 RepID=UPI000F08528E|nr:hypothetical protein [Arcobacter peruensis]
MKYEELISELCDVIKESENNAALIYEDLEWINQTVDSFSLLSHEKEKVQKKVSNALGLLQHQDLHRQKIERVVNFVCEHNNIDKTKYGLAPSAKNIDSSDEIMNEDELEALIKQMQAQ